MEFQLRQATQEDYPRIVAMINAEVNEPTTVENLIRQDEIWPKEDPNLRLVAVTPEGLIVGSSHSSGGRLMKPGSFNIHVRVDFPYRKQGVGSALYTAMEQWAREQGAQRLEANAREKDPAYLAFAEQRGFVREHHVFESTLDMAQFDPTPFEDAVTAARDSGIRFTTLAEIGTDDETMYRFFEFMWDVSRDVPGSEGQPKPPWELVKKAWANDPYFDPKLLVMAIEGDRWAAMAHMVRTEKGAAYHAFTGVHRDFRGRRLALAVKVVALRMVRELGFPYARTNNHSSNQRMLAVNRKLGYVPEPGFFTFVKEL